MAVWMYQLNAHEWPRDRYLLEIWEGERWSWHVRQVRGEGKPGPGDIMLMYWVKTDNPHPGFCGWAVVTEWHEIEGPDGLEKRIYFRPVAPSDQLKMNPLWDGSEGSVAQLVNDIRSVTRGTLFRVSEEQFGRLRELVRVWLGGGVLS